jgi:predicted amidohydrolase YtcJ
VSIAHGFLIDREDIQSCQRLGIGVSCHPILGYVYAEEMYAAWGPLAGRANPLASMLALGARVSGGSDTLPCAPLAGAAAAVTRMTWKGTSMGADEAIAPYQGLRLFLQSAGAYVNDDRVGVLAPGSFADFAVWPSDPLAVPPSQWPEMTSAMTVVGGRVAYSSDHA